MKIPVVVLIIFFLWQSALGPCFAQAPTTVAGSTPAIIPATKPYSFKKLSTEAYPGKQDDIFMVNENLIWYGNGKGKLYRSTNGGEAWELMLDKPGTFWRCLAFSDSLNGYAGNVGTDYFPNVTDTIPLYRTTDGGKTWKPATIIGGMPKGLCALFIQKKPFVNHGVLAYKTIIWGAGRVGSPAWLVSSTDNGNTFLSRKLDTQTSAIFDICFTTSDTGYICGASHPDVDKARPQVLQTTNGGKTWQEVFRGKNDYEITWKSSFPTSQTGYVTIQNYNPDTTVKARYVIKTTNAGKTWQELPLANLHALRQFGIGFANPSRGWVGTTAGGYETSNGGLTWQRVTLGRAVNKFRIGKRRNGKLVGFAIGADVYRLDEE